MTKNIQTIILAAGQGTRMKSVLPKVLNPLALKPLLNHVIDTAEILSKNISVIVGHQAELVKSYCGSYPTYEQKRQLGTGHAVQMVIGDIEDDKLILVLYGDVPLIKSETLKALIESTKDGLAILTVEMDNPDGYGRIIREAGKVLAIVEQKDANVEQKQIKEVNTGILTVNGALLKKYLSKLSNNNAQEEYYLTDIIQMHVNSNKVVNAYICQDETEVQGVNDKWQLANLERQYQLNKARELCLLGVNVSDPTRLDVRGTLKVGMDVTINPNVIFEGKVSLGNGVTVGANSIIKDSIIGDNTNIKENSLLEQSKIGKNCEIGPFARLRPGTVLGDNVKVGNFVEIKKSQINEGSKVNHLSYIGDTTMGKGVNIGAGTITCNYDGAFKHKTQIGDDVFVGSASQLVAPVKINKGSTVGAGSTITKDVLENDLVVTRTPQKSIQNWKRPKK